MTEAANPLASEANLLESPDEAARITVAEKWEGAVTSRSGFVAVPVALLRLQSKYGLKPTDMLVLINLLAHWWDPNGTVFPRTTTIANRMGVDKRTVQRSTNKLIKVGLLSRANLPDGKRTFSFNKLTSRLARDVTVAYSIQGIETLDG